MSYWVAGAMVVSAAYSAYSSNKASKDATSAQTNAAQQGINAQTSQFDKQTALQAPWRNAGASSVGYLSYLMGVPGYQNWQPGANTSIPGAPNTTATGSKPKLLGVFAKAADPIGGGWLSDPAGSALGFGFNAPPQGSGSETPTQQGGPSQMAQIANRTNKGISRPIIPSMQSSGGIPMFSSPAEPGFQQLPSGSHFIGPDGVERMKH